jgi:ureidoglycolate lyase
MFIPQGWQKSSEFDLIFGRDFKNKNRGEVQDKSEYARVVQQKGTTMITHARVIHINAQPLSVEAFAPFGVILSPEGRERLPINTYGDKLDLYREAFETNQPIEWLIAHFRKRDFSALFLERHAQLSQTFVPLGGKAFLMVVAAKDARLENGLPAEDQIRAFVVPGDCAVQLFRSTWHENPFALEAEQTLLVTSHAALTRGHQQNPDASLAQLLLDLERVWFKEQNLELHVSI